MVPAIARAVRGLNAPIKPIGKAQSIMTYMT